MSMPRLTRCSHCGSPPNFGPGVFDALTDQIDALRATQVLAMEDPSMALDRETEIAQNYCVRITGPGIDHQVMVNSTEDFEALELIIAKMRKYFATQNNPGGNDGR
jgi:hypothetical protein